MTRLAEYVAWIQERFRAGVMNGDVIRQEPLARGIVASLRTVNRALGPLRCELVLANRATICFETPPGRQMQADFGEVIGGQGHPAEALCVRGHPGVLPPNLHPTLSP